MCVQAVAVFDVCCLASLAWPGLADRGREGPGLGLACARGDGWSREDAGSSLELQPPEIMPSLAHTLTAPRVVARMTDGGCYSITNLGCTALSLGGGIQRRISQPGNFNPKNSCTAQREQARGSFCLQLRVPLPSAVRAVALGKLSSLLTVKTLTFMFELRPPSAIPQKCVLRPKELYYSFITL